MLVVPDVEDVFVPMGQDLFVDPEESRYRPARLFSPIRIQIEALLYRIEAMFPEITPPEPAFGATMLAAVSALVYTCMAC
jgi:protein transport protein SEC24